jgi:hypothetical protein
MLTRTRCRLWRLTAVGLAALMVGTLIPVKPASADRGRRIVVVRHAPGPRIGHPVARFPAGHHRIHAGAVPYFFHAGRYYRPVRRGYVHVRPPVGAVIAALPLGFLTLTVGSLLYFYHSDVYYRRVPAGYMVVDPPREAVVVRETPAAEAPEDQEGALVVVTAPRLNVRSGPGDGFEVIAVIDQGLSLEIRGSAADWLYVKMPDGRHGWVLETYTSPILPPASG